MIVSEDFNKSEIRKHTFTQQIVGLYFSLNCVGWRKIAFYFNLSFEIKDKSIEFDENRNVQRAEFVVRAYMQYVDFNASFIFLFFFFFFLIDW